MEIRGERKQWGQICVLLWLLLSCCSIRQSSALSLTVDEVECVYEYVLHDGDTISGNFVVVDSDIFWTADHLGTDFTVTSPDGNIVHSLKASVGDKFELKAPQSGMYKFCFHNPSSDPNTVSFHIHVGHIPTEHDLAKDEHLDPINVKIAQLREALESVTGEQKYLKARDTRHRHSFPWDMATYIVNRALSKTYTGLLLREREHEKEAHNVHSFRVSYAGCCKWNSSSNHPKAIWQVCRIQPSLRSLLRPYNSFIYFLLLVFARRSFFVTLAFRNLIYKPILFSAMRSL